ncbi:MAG TPA: hypothetical protein VFK44_14195 [Bacillales bacterium]|nr:hypothetical protein [Bacillales bacterium]
MDLGRTCRERNGSIVTMIAMVVGLFVFAFVFRMNYWPHLPFATDSVA